MIYRRKRKRRRTQFERMIRAGETAPILKPEYIAAHDFTLDKENLNPFRQGTRDHDEYERSYTKLTEELTTCRKLNDHRTRKQPPSGDRTL